MTLQRRNCFCFSAGVVVVACAALCAVAFAAAAPPFQQQQQQGGGGRSMPMPGGGRGAPPSGMRQPGGSGGNEHGPPDEGGGRRRGPPPGGIGMTAGMNVDGMMMEGGGPQQMMGGYGSGGPQAMMGGHRGGGSNPMMGGAGPNIGGEATLQPVGPQADETPRDTAEDIAELLLHESQDLADYRRVFEAIEDHLNPWVCAVGGRALYEGLDDRQTMSMFSNLLSRVLMKVGQAYGSGVVAQFASVHSPRSFSCQGVVYLKSAEFFDRPVTLLLLARERLTAWLQKHKVGTAKVLDLFVPVFRMMLGRWVTSRVMTQEIGPSTPPPVFPEALPLGMLPLYDDDGQPSERCHFGGVIFTMYARQGTKMSDQLAGIMNRLLDMCVISGRVSNDPKEQADTLLRSGRETEARELFIRAVEKGLLCNAFQRPLMQHRKDLTARAIWPNTEFGGLLAAVGDLAKEVHAHLDGVPWPRNSSQMSTFVTKGAWERVIFHHGAIVKRDTCAYLGDRACQLLGALVDGEFDNNDAYPFSCNGTLLVDLWKMSVPLQTVRATGGSNLALQVMVPLKTNGANFIVRAGEEAVLGEEFEAIVMDDTFENVLETSWDEGARLPPADDEHEDDDDRSVVVLHVQICHPDMSELALTPPDERCRGR